MSFRVITGGQVGVDVGAWRAARACGIETGGWMPPGFMTEAGPRPEFAELYGAIEIREGWANASMAAQYRERTRLNVEEATHVLLLTADADSPGSKLTWNLAIEGEKERLGVEVHAEWDATDEISSFGWNARIIPDFVRDCVEKGGVLMVAGTRESKDRGIENWVEVFLAPIFYVALDWQEGGPG